ncbi:MAG: hypothetical protein HFG52_16980 [Lachnospiraceae bacterium]|nr:hypothetical protein [Lachnospiraceae bacterium]
MKEKDQVQTNSLVFEYLGVISYTACCVMCILAYPLFHLLFEGDTVSGYIVSPYLFLAPLLQMLFQVASNQFLVIKKTWPILLILGQGAVLNVLLNGILIPRIGIEGAAIATLLGYAWSDLICIVVLKKMGLMAISRRFTWTAILLFVYMIGWRLLLKRTTGMSLAGVLLFFMYVVWSYKKEVGFLFGLGWKRKK